MTIPIDRSDADSDVLADYVLALLKHEQGDDEVERLCIDQLDDFLRERQCPVCSPVPELTQVLQTPGRL